MMIRARPVLTTLLIALLGSVPAPALAQPTRRDTVRASVQLVIGELSATTPHEFGFVSGVAVDGEGRIYVSDRIEATVLVFARDGRLLGRVGRKGQGPGEFEAPTGPVITADGALIVRNMERATRFVRDPGTGLLSRYESDLRYPGYPDWLSTRASRVDASGRFSFPGYLAKRDAPVRRFVLRFDRTGSLEDTLHVPTYGTSPPLTAYIPTGPGGGRMVAGLNAVPFTPEPAWDVTPRGTIVSGDGRTYTLAETDAAGRIVRRFERSVQPMRIPSGERRDSLRALERRIDSLPVPLASVVGVAEAVKARRLPDVLPAYIDVVAAADGRIWVRRWPPTGRASETFFDVFDADGSFRATVELPMLLETGRRGPTPHIGEGMIVGVIMDPDTDTQSVVRLGFSLGR